MQLWLKPELAQSIIEQAQQAQPNECCGVIVGEGIRAEQIVAIANIADDPAHHYRMDDKALLKVMFQTQRQNLEVIGFYHSHPRSAPIPSQEDIHHAHYPDTAYVIASLKGGEAQLSAWAIKRDHVTLIDLVVSVEKPAPKIASLSIIQKRAIIASAIIAFIFMLVLSLSLLPPAPIIPIR
jgi:proteasome lid subunit RPN8/RPN11